MVAWPNLLSQMEVWFEIYRIREHEWNLPSHTTRICVSGPGAFSSRCETHESRCHVGGQRGQFIPGVKIKCMSEIYWKDMKELDDHDDDDDDDHDCCLVSIYIYMYISYVYPTGLSNMCNSWKTSTIRMVCIGTILSTECTNLPEVSSWPSEGSFSHGVVGNIEQSVLETSQ